MKQNIITISGKSHIGKTTYINNHFDVKSSKAYKASYLDDHETLETNVAKNDYNTIIIDEINSHNDPQIHQLIKHLLDILIAKNQDINLVLCGTCPNLSDYVSHLNCWQEMHVDRQTTNEDFVINKFTLELN